MSAIQLSNGVSIPLNPSKGSTTGVKGAAYDPSTGGMRSPFVAIVPRAEVVSMDPRMSNFKAGGGMMHLGFFDDPRKAAYASAEFMQKPLTRKQRIDNWFKLGDKASIRNDGFGTYDFPSDLMTNPELAAAVEPAVKNWDQQAQEYGGKGGNYADPKARDWRGLTSSLGIKGSQIVGIMPGDRAENERFISQLALKSADVAKQELLKRGVDLDNQAVVDKIKASTTTKESMMESQQQLDRIKQLIKY